MSNPPIVFRILLAVSTLALLVAAIAIPASLGGQSTEVAALIGEETTSRAIGQALDDTGLDHLASVEPREAGGSFAFPSVVQVEAVVDETTPSIDSTLPAVGPTDPGRPSSTTTAPVKTTSTVPKSTTSTSTPNTTTVNTGPKTASGPITISNQSGAVIENLSISNPNGACIRVIGSSNVTIRNSTIGPCGDWAVFIDKSSGVTVEKNTIKTASSKGGVYGHSSSGVAVLGNTISHSGRNPIQFDKVTGAGNRIEGNSVSSSPSEDMINVFKSGGTSGSWLRIVGNTLKDNTGQSRSGSGIMLGDAGGSYVLVEGNKLTNPGQAGIGVAGGSNIRVLNNTVVSAQFAWSNVGIYVWDQYNSNCHSIEVRGNNVSWLNSSGQNNPAWLGGGCGDVAGWNQNSW
jgi:hypothetical protein